MPEAVLSRALSRPSSSVTSPRFGSAGRRTGSSPRRPSRSCSTSRAPRTTWRLGRCWSGRRQQPGRCRRRLPRHCSEDRDLGHRAAERDLCGGAFVTVPAGEAWDDFVAHAVEQGWGGHRGAVRHPRAASGRPRSRTSAPMARRSPRPSPGPVLGPRRPRRQDVRRRRVRLRLPHQPVQGRPAALRRAVRDVPVPPRLRGAPVRYAELARALGVEVGTRAPMTDGARRCAGAAPEQGDGARRRRPRHLERRVLLHQPLSSPRAPAGAPAWPQPDGRVKTSAAWLIENAGFAKGYGNERVAPLDQAHARAHQPRHRHDQGPAGARRGAPARGVRRVRRSGWSTSRCSSVARCPMSRYGPRWA